MVMACLRSTGRPGSLHGDFESDFSRLLKLKHYGERMALFEWLFKTDQHDVMATGYKRDCLMWR